MDQLYMLRAFVAATQHKSFSKAAASLGVTTGSISKAIAKLEASIQTRVLHRTTRSVTLTEEAQAYYLSCVRLLEEFDEANRRITRAREVDSGKLRLAVHPALVNGTFLKMVSEYHALAPNVNLMVSIQEDVVNLYDGRYDVAIVPPQLVEQSAVIRRTLSKTPNVLVATPAYLDRHGMPAHVEDMSRHFLLIDPRLRQTDSHFIALFEHGRPVSVLPMASLDGNEALLRAAALMGTGIAVLPEAMIRQDIDDGNLMHVLPGCSTSESEIEICLFYSHRELLPARFRTFVDFCAAFFSERHGRQRAPRNAPTHKPMPPAKPTLTIV
ncbi:LysR family transcriptional regulator [Paraburkholderia sp. DHOC27]|uniref:LysR family transcriptional regulator n=1 Tax=Paraburkholderia sp. DHOC27 TaxID=2303330 RepID=UPI000E3C3097|nr:LysR family transcriptional regulator [Paraburkholderia sp. DHOC27]RFU48844.1 LysR family transcriptional regulator [Paraburkholderia sp. DHOC27]